jgi:hypothetical protein
MPITPKETRASSELYNVDQIACWGKPEKL